MSQPPDAELDRERQMPVEDVPARWEPGVVRGRWWHPIDAGRIHCDLCPRFCTLADGQRGFCYVRQNRGGQMVLTTWGRASGYCIDPIEKKPLYHFLPGTPVLSFGTAGCNLGCKFCQNWDISKARADDRLAATGTPDAIAEAAVARGCRSVAFTYNDPVIFAEYALDVAAACRERGVRTVAVTAGYVGESARADFFGGMDATNVDLKAFTEGFYRKLCFAHLAPVLDTLAWLKAETSVWLEVTTLIIPGENDSEDEIEKLAVWFLEHLGPETPLHLSAFHPDYKMTEHARTPPATLARARRQALAVGLRHVYTGNVHDVEGQTTYCAGCGVSLIERDWYQLGRWSLSADGGCTCCGRRLAGHLEPRPGTWGPRRLPIAVER